MSSHLRIGKRHLKGFTLIELMIVVVIIALLSALATTSYLKAQSTARDDTRKTDVSAISAAVETYYATNKTFPGNITAATTPTSGLYAGCQSFTAGVGYFYYNKPGTDCTANATVSGSYTATDYAPAPSWIPGLSSFINPIPTEKRYQDNSTAANPITATSLLAASDAKGSTNDLRTYVYRHLNGGYQVYARLENPSSGDNYYNGGNSVSCPTGSLTLPATGQNLYIICK